ncbi:Flavin-binding monooxygenase [Mycena sanguinolenta]|uniref:Flavin-binding monooxygenase n=1 Tax=Mycena sanguinolenta TaxID=230812 RepID=A0A8H7CUC1_9AGAR|nr:Flavin-binding monooxygenase [Mycena sanguinolenta]
MMLDASQIANSWLENFGRFLEGEDISGATSCFVPHGFLRDILVFTWNNRTLAGWERMATYLKDTLTPAAVTQVKVKTRPNLAPETRPLSASVSSVCSAFTFVTAVGHGQGYFMLRENENGEWKALTVFFMLTDIKGHEESGLETGIYGRHTLAWHDVHRECRQAIERDPHVLIIGAGQNGLNVGARFRQMNIPTLIIENLKTMRVGDIWRQRYPILTLHTPKSHHGTNWPIYTPRDKLADWLEQYAISQDLVVWTNSHALPTPTYDPATKCWKVVIDHAGKHVTLHTAHIVLAAGTIGAPHIPTIPDADLFEGSTIHSAAYVGGKDYVGKRTLIVSAGNSSADICQDLAFHKASEVTMLQRSTTCVVAAKNVRRMLEHVHPYDVHMDVSDFKWLAVPLLLVKEMGKASMKQMWAEETETHKGLREAGMSLTMGKDGGGQYPMFFERFGGYIYDVGITDMIRSGQVKIKQGVEIARFTKNSAMFTDGSSLEIDTVVFATSYENIRNTMRRLFGDAVMDQTSTVWGVDEEEGEINGCYRPTGYPHLWYASGDFSTSRFCSKQLASCLTHQYCFGLTPLQALEIKAIELGLMPS